MNLINAEFKRKFSVSLYKNLKLKLAEMSFYKDFVNDKRGDLYPVVDRTDDACESVCQNIYKIGKGRVERLFCRFFPYATYELRAKVHGGAVGFAFNLPSVKSSIMISKDKISYLCGKEEKEFSLPEYACGEFCLIVSCRPGAFDLFFEKNGKAEFFCTVDEADFMDSNLESNFENGTVHLLAADGVDVFSAESYIDSGISLADMRTIRYENGEVMVENGRVYFTGSIRMCAQMFQGVFSWVPGTLEIELCGALFYNCGDGRWCGDVAASVLYHRSEKMWYLWVCSFSHGHVLAHAKFDGDPRFGVNVIDVNLMEKAPADADISTFLGFKGDEDPDFFYDAQKDCWLMAICRTDPATKKYRYVFFESENAFDGYKFIGKGLDGAETGGSFVKIDGEQYFICGNDFNSVSDYRIYHKGGMVNAKFDYPDGGFRGWGTVIPVKMGSRTRYFWLTFDRHNGSSYNWSYGNLYCFEAR